MKKITKLLSIFLCGVMVLTLLPLSAAFTASAETEEGWDYYTVRQYNSETAPHIFNDEIFGWSSEATTPVREFTRDYAPSASEWSLKMSAPAGESRNLYLIKLLNEDYITTTAGMRMWVANPSDTEVYFRWLYTTDSKYSAVNPNKAYYLQAKNSDKVYSHTTGTYNSEWGKLFIPAGFVGWVYAPFTSTTFGDLNTYNRIWIQLDDGNEVYFSTVQYYSDSAVTLQSNTDYYFDSFLPYSDSSDVNTGSIKATGTSTVALSTENRDGDFGQSIKVNYSAASVNTAVRLDMYSLCTKLKDDTADGISFWAKNPQEYAITLTIMVYEYKNINKNAPYYLKPDGGDAYTCYTGSSPFDGGDRATITLPAGFAGKVYLPYNTSGTTNGVVNLKSGMLALVGYVTESMPSFTMYYDSFDNYTFEEIGNLTTMTFDRYSAVEDSFMWSYSGNSEISSADTEGGSGKSIKARTSSTESVPQRFRNLAPSADIACYSGELGYRFWISNPNDFAVSAMTQFFEYQRALVGKKYYLEYEYGGASAEYFKALHPLSGVEAGYNELGCITIPANFRGWVYIPRDSIFNGSSTGNAANVTNGWTFIMTIFATKQDSYVYIDSYGLYTEEPEISTIMRSVPTVFSDGALFQQNKDINIWGYNFPNSSITAELYKGEELIETATAVTGSNNRFDLSFSAREGSYDSYSIVIKDSIGTIAEINDILIGELWLSGGQSNMEFVIGQTDSYEEILQKANDEYLRFFLEPTAPTAASGKAQPAYVCEDIPGAYWEYGNTTTNALKNNMSAVACVFAYELKEKLDVPVGVIDTAVGGTRVDAWLGREATAANEEVLSTVRYWAVDQTPTSYTWTTLYNQKIGPLAGLNIAGTVWYQGESNSNVYSTYAKQLDLLKESWGEIFGFENDDMPFIYTQVAPDCYDNGENNWFQLGYLAEAMNDAFLMNDSSNTAMLTLYDVSLAYGNEGTIHPNVKIPVGERFANAAMTLCYGGTAEASAPVFDSIEVKGDTVYVNFTHTGTGLSCTGEDIHGFNIAGSDGVYVNAKAKIIDSDTVMVWNDYLKDPVNVTYAFANMNQAANLVNSSGLPAAPFRSDRNAATYMTIEEWMNADADAWESIDGNLSDFKPSWTVSAKSATVSYSYSADVKTEGDASLAVSLSEPDTVSVAPVINTYDGKAFNAANYKSIKLDIKANQNACVSLVVTDSNGNTYNAYVNGTDSTAAVLQNSDFNTVVFSLESLYSSEGTVTDVADILTNANISFEVSDATTETLYIDNISVGMTAAAAVFGDVNDDGEMNADDLTLIKKHLLGIECDVNLVKCDANNDNDINIIDLIRAKKNIVK